MARSDPRVAPVRFRGFAAGDVVQLQLQPSQHVTLGLVKPRLSYEDGEELAGGGPAWTAISGASAGAGGGRVLACFGATFLWPPEGEFTGHAVAWALLGEGVGAAQLAISRYAAERIAESPIGRIEAVVRADMAKEEQWLRLLGLRRSAVLRRWGPEGRDHLLFERLK